MGKVLNMTFTSSLANLCEVNSSFDAGILRICYTGRNRNNSFISKQAIEQNIGSLYNCPIVCSYDRETDTLGGHDVEIVRDGGDGLRIINMTYPVGVIPESAGVWFENYEDDDGTVHEYLFAEVLLWKRQEAYRKIKNNGITAHSMEINVKSGKSIDGIYYIDDFEFTAFALIGCEPCYESSALEVFSESGFKRQFSEMMQDLKETLTTVNIFDKDDDIKTKKHLAEGGERTLEEKKNGKSNNGRFVLTSNIVDEIIHVLSEEKVVCERGEHPHYQYVDCDIEANEVYCWDCTDWLLYGFVFTVDGGRVVVDWASKKRKKYVVVDFDEGEQVSPFADASELMEDKIRDLEDYEAKFNTASDTIASMRAELGELRRFKADAENAAAAIQREEVFARFGDLEGIEAFEALRKDCMEYDVDALEEKCFAIRGRNSTSARFALENKTPKLKVTKNDNTSEPYGGLFKKYTVYGSEL